MILYKKIFFFQSIFFGSLIVLILSLNSCINSCDNTNSTVAKISIDSTSKLKGTWFTSIGIEKKRISPPRAFINEGGTFEIILNLDKDSTIVHFFITDTKTGKDSVTYQLVLAYTTKPYLPGPDCGMDVRINNLSIKSHNFPEDKNPILSTNQITTATAPNVKIRL